MELHTIFTTRDPTWDGVNLTIWSQAELSIGILIASLPPLRKALTKVFQHLLPSTVTGSHKTPQYGHTSGQNIRMRNFEGSKAYNSRIRAESSLQRDDDSDRAILDESEHKGSGIMKSTTVTVKGVTGESNNDTTEHSSIDSLKPALDWNSPRQNKSTNHVV